MDKILSVSIASYNVQDYIRNCLDSFICEKDVMNRFEVIVVNDGSKDDTLTIANEYSSRFPDTFIVLDKQNGGYGSTINASLNIARGKYFKLVDGDDWVETNEFIKLIKLLIDTDSDLFVTKYTTVSDVDGQKKLAIETFPTMVL